MTPAPTLFGRAPMTRRLSKLVENLTDGNGIVSLKSPALHHGKASGRLWRTKHSLVNPMCKYYFHALVHPEPAVACMGFPPSPFLRRESTRPEQTCQGLDDPPPAWKNLRIGLVGGFKALVHVPSTTLLAIGCGAATLGCAIKSASYGIGTHNRGSGCRNSLPTPSGTTGRWTGSGCNTGAVWLYRWCWKGATGGIHRIDPV